MAENYVPLPWVGTEWKATRYNQGGQPSAKVVEGGDHIDDLFSTPAKPFADIEI